MKNETEITQNTTLRDYFAAESLTAVCAQYDVSRCAEIATAVYKIADAMLAERQKEI